MSNGADEMVGARAIRALLESALAAGVQVDAGRFAMSRASGRDEELVPVARLVDLSRELMSVDRADVGLAIGSHAVLESTGPWGFLLRSSATYGQMLRRGREYGRMAGPFPQCALEPRGGRVALVSSCPKGSALGPRHQVVTAAMSRWIAWGRRLTGVDFPVIEARIGGPAPSDPAPWTRFFRGRVIFGAAEDAYLLDTDVLDLPLRGSAPELGDALEEAARSSLYRLDGPHAFLDRFRRALEEELRQGRHDADHVAGRLTMTPRTLQRRLARENTSFRRFRDALLRRRAERLLCDSDATLQQVSAELGYADPPSFSRAFRRWTGMAPGAWRERSIRR